ncbi:phytase [Actinoplanes sp. SE50]|nr:3-phytase [Actinoplanes sp. SE50/110]ATO79559.1 phytase [Actinoplanes sp. SE50]SLL96960.1 3-phytase precursor [Actinoplanes sp. SE50/110]
MALTTLAAGTPAFASERRPAREITAEAETAALHDDDPGGNGDTDDAAVWVDPANRTGSLVIGTARNGGLRVSDLTGREVQSIATPDGGRFSNVDIVSGFRLAGQKVDLAVVTDRGLDRLRVYRIGASGLTDVTSADAPLLFSRDQAEVRAQATGYGLATYGRYAVVSRRRTTRLGLFRLEERQGRVTYRTSDTLDLPSSFRLPDGGTWSPCAEPGQGPQIEGLVVDAEAGVLYAAQEDVALWRIPLTGGTFSSIPRIVPSSSLPRTVAFRSLPRTGPSRSLPWALDAGKPCDTTASVSLPGYPKGLLVLPHGENITTNDRASTDFKFLDWRNLQITTF